MADPSAETVIAEHQANHCRWASICGALIASLLFLALAASRDQLDGWIVAASFAALAISAVIVRSRIRVPSQRSRRAHSAPDRLGAADAILANIPDPVILVDARVVVVEMNEAARSLSSGLKSGRPLSFALRSPDVLGGIDQVLATGAPLKVEYAERVPTERAFEVLIGPLKTESHQLETRSGVVLFFRDLTEARRLENMRVDFVANASHELRTPLASLLGFIETLQGPARNDAAARDRFLEIMRGQAHRMTRLIDDLLSLSQIEMRAHIPPRGTADLASLTAQMIDALAPLARERGVEIRFAGLDGPMLVQGDKDELLRVVENLVENAVKYGESGRRVDVGLVRSPDRQGSASRVELSVRDYGPGIASEHLPRLTERFYRVDVAHSREKGGTGLGLAIVKHIVNRHGGTLTIESRPGEGALFKVVLPVGPARP
jgi:two-component system, OmpR family, phosphate regulon sensor histidine kinase PhoR